MSLDKPLAAWQRVALLSLLALCLALNLRYALFWPDEERFYDERFNNRNVHGLLSGDRAEMNSWYPPVTWVPHALVLGGIGFAVRAFGGEFDPAADPKLAGAPLALARSLQVAQGLASLLLLFWLARRLFSVEVGLLAIAVLGLAPWFLHGFSVFKPDATLALATLLSARALIAASARPSAGSYAALGAAVALAAGSKLTGIALTLPVVVLIVAHRRERRLWTRHLPAAAASGAGLFVLLNPQILDAYFYFMRIVRFYDQKQAVDKSSRLDGVLDLVRWPTADLTFGLALGLASLLGLAVWLGVALRRFRSAEATARAHLAVAAIPFAFALAYFAGTAFFKANNFLPVLPFLALGAAVPLARAARWLREFAPRGWGRFAFAAVFAAVLIARLGTAVPYVERSVTPTTFDRLIGQARAEGQLGANAVLLSEWGDRGRIRYEREHYTLDVHSAVGLVPDIAALSSERRRAVDGEIYRARRGFSPPLGPGTLLAVEPALFRVRGPALVGRFHPWAPGEEIAGFDQKRTYFEPHALLEPRLPQPVAPGDYLQVAIWLMREGPQSASPPSLEIEGRAVPVHYGQPFGGGDLYATERVQIGSAEPALRFTPPADRDPRQVGMQIFRWSKPPS